MRDRNLKWAIEACRVGSDDVSLPEMSPLAEAIQQDVEVRRVYERSQQFDAAIQRAFCDVPVPDGLAERLLTAVQAQPEELPVSAGDVEVSRSVSVHEQEPTPRSRRLFGSRTWVGIAVTVAVLVCIAVLRPFYAIPLEPTPGETLPRDVLTWNGRIEQKGWKVDPNDPRLEQRPFSKYIRAVPRRWCEIDTGYDGHAIAYDLGRGSQFAVLFCLKSRNSRSVLGSSPQPKPVSETGAFSLGVWRRGDLVYVLAVKGGEQQYRGYLQSTMLLG